MKNIGQGLFFDTRTPTHLRQVKTLTEFGWVEVFNGFWALKSEIDLGADPRDISLCHKQAYKLARVDQIEYLKPKAPEPTWLAPDHLPGLKEAQAFDLKPVPNESFLSFQNQFYKTGVRGKFVYDIECYDNYFLIAFMCISSNNIFYLEVIDGALTVNQSEDLKWIFENNTTVGYNSNGYDIFIASLAASGIDTKGLKSATEDIIENNERGYDVLKKFKVRKIKSDHIDIMHVAPGKGEEGGEGGSLKIYGGRVHTKRMQDLPFPPDTILSPDQISIVRHYCVNDLTTTLDLYNKLIPQLRLREKMGASYGIDLRSKSDAQIAEAVYRHRLKGILGDYWRPSFENLNGSFKFMMPEFVQFKTPMLNRVKKLIQDLVFDVDCSGKVSMPEQLGNLEITIADGVYKLGKGGIHSQERSVSYYSDDEFLIEEEDVESYYPRTMINQNIRPDALGNAFQVEFNDIVQTRLDAKHRGDESDSDSLKIVINGTFGKLGSAYSVLFNPQGMIQTTISGQLSLLMLIEEFELMDITVVSANTDGVVVKKPRSRLDEISKVVNNWMQKTGYKMEQTPYKSIHYANVNNYIAFAEEKGGIKAKAKGYLGYAGLSKNPTNEICIDAVVAYLKDGISIHETVLSCNDIRKFVTIRKVKGGGVFVNNDGQTIEYLGKAVRWYYAKNNDCRIVYAGSGNKVSKSDGAMPIMDLPEKLPHDLDLDYYINEANERLIEVGLNV